MILAYLLLSISAAGVQTHENNVDLCEPDPGIGRDECSGNRGRVIEGRAFGTPVSGAWNWSDGYFCRDLYYGERDLGSNCQQVAIRDNTIRFTSDFGNGDYADLRLR